MQDNNPYIITEKRTVRRIYWGRIIAFIVIISLAVIGGVLWFSRSSGKVETGGREYWFVSMGEFSDLSEASSCADSVIEAGGAGYVFGKSDYKVAAACYANKTDALTVSERLAANGGNCSVFSINCSSVKTEKPKDNVSLYKKLLAYPAQIFDELQKISVKVDTKELSESAALYAVLKMSVVCDEYARECEHFDEAGAYMHELFGSVSVSLDNLARVKEKVPQSIKYTLCEIAVEICDLTNEFVK